MGNLAKAGLVALVLIGVWTSWAGSSRERDAPGGSDASPAADRSEDDVALVEVPRLVGVHDSFARHLLQMTHLRPGRIRLERSAEPWGSVIFQSVAPGSPVPPGTRVGLVLAKGSVPQPCRLYWCATSLEDAAA
jgi:hypothetical protein